MIETARRAISTAGVTAGIDLALALVERDCGVLVAQRVARRLVVYLRRTGDQRRYSQTLRIQDRAGAPFGALIEKIEANLAHLWSVCQLPVNSVHAYLEVFGHTAPSRPKLRKSMFSEFQIVSTIKQVEGSRQVKDVCRELRISDTTYYMRNSKYGGMEASDARRLKGLEGENARLKRMYADLAQEVTVLKDMIAKRLQVGARCAH